MNRVSRIGDDASAALKFAAEKFEHHFEEKADAFGCAPGRVELLGNHTDWNEGMLISAAIDKHTFVLGRRIPPKPGSISQYTRIMSSDPACTRVVTLKSDAIHGFTDSTFMDSWLCTTVATSPSRQGRPSSHRPKIKKFKDDLDKWANYILGVIDEINRELELIECPPLQGCDIYVHSLVPTGCGVASSAALEVATACMLRELFPQVKKLNDKTIVNLCRRAEQNFVGNMCGIMDQLTSYFGKNQHALCLDFQNCGEHEYHPFQFDDEVGLVLASIDAPPNDPVCKHEIDRLRKKVEDCKDILRQAIPAKYTNFFSNEWNIA